MDIDAVRAGAILICPVKLAGGGVYMGDMHALQGDGEIAGHTCDVSGTVTLQVEVIKDLSIDGPLLFPLAEDLPFLARPLSAASGPARRRSRASGALGELEESAPISVIGSGPDLNSATDNGLERAAELLEMAVPEVKNSATIAGAIEIGRHPGVVQVTLRARPSTGSSSARCCPTSATSTGSARPLRQCPLSGSGRAPRAPARARGRSPSSAGPFGSHSSQLGRYQFQSPSSFIAAGSSTPRTSVASISTAAARPTPNCFMSMNESVAKMREHADHHERRRAHHAGGRLDAVATASSVDSPRSTASLIRLRMNTW